MQNKRTIVNDYIDKFSKANDHVSIRKIVGNNLLQEEIEQNKQESIIKR